MAVDEERVKTAIQYAYRIDMFALLNIFSVSSHTFD